jgi:hypothetical protein
MTRSFRALFLGLFILFLSKMMWEITGNFVGWLVFFLPGSGLVLIGCFWAVEDD